MSGKHADRGDDHPEFRIVSGRPDAQEIAAVTAVLHAMIEENAASGDEASPQPRSAWQVSQRALRGPVAPAPGAWRGFSG